MILTTRKLKLSVMGTSRRLLPAGMPIYGLSQYQPLSIIDFTHSPAMTESAPYSKGIRISARQICMIRETAAREINTSDEYIARDLTMALCLFCCSMAIELSTNFS